MTHRLKISTAGCFGGINLVTERSFRRGKRGGIRLRTLLLWPFLNTKRPIVPWARNIFWKGGFCGHGVVLPAWVAWSLLSLAPVCVDCNPLDRLLGYNHRACLAPAGNARPRFPERRRVRRSVDMCLPFADKRTNPCAQQLVGQRAVVFRCCCCNTGNASRVVLN